MPEYLAPAVYVEEVDTGSKPIEGVSTSTAGMIGVTERGPVNVPILITSLGEYRRWFGDYLNAAEFATHQYLPHAVEGFFGNGGKRTYITRVLAADAALTGQRVLFEQLGTPDLTLPLVARALPLDGDVVVLGPTTAPTVAGNDWFRIGSGGDAEYVRATTPLTAPSAALAVVPVNLPLSRTFANNPVTVQAQATALPTTTVTGNLSAAALPGARSISVRMSGSTSVAAGAVLAIGNHATGDEELIIAETVIGTMPDLVVTLETPTQIAHAATTTPVGAYSLASLQLTTPASATTTRPAQAGDTLLSGVVLAGLVPNQLLFVRNGTGTNDHMEVRRAGELQQQRLGVDSYVAYPAGSRVEHFTRADAGALRALTAPAAAGATVIELDRRDGIAITPGSALPVLRIGAANDPDVEYVAVQALPNEQPVLNPGRVILAAPLRRNHGPGPVVQLQTLTAVAATGSGTATVVHTAILTLATPLGSRTLIASRRGWPIAPPPITECVRVTTQGGGAYYHRIDAAENFAAHQLTFSPPLALGHAAGTPATSAEPLLDVLALDQGAWGNRLRIAARTQDPPLVRAAIRTINGSAIRLTSSAGVEVGTILQLVDAQERPLGAPFKVDAIDRQNGYELTIPTGTLPAIAGAGSRVRSVEFQLDVYLLRQPDPALPSRNDTVIDSESFRYLSLDPRHSRYLHRIIGTTWTAGAPGDLDDDRRPLRKVDRRSEGESQYIRVRDRATGDAELERLRLGPDLLVDVRPDGRTLPSRLPLLGGDDQIPALTDDHYIGQDAAEPIDRTGLVTLRNIEEISIIACPGRTSVPIQNALINHCELMRYRFAALDGSPPPGDTIADVQAQRSQYDTKYAALYHPWLLIPSKYPLVAGAVEEYAIPPSGHMLGIYARTDIERGVHKAPANEVVRGIMGLRRTLNKEHHDILNPYPVNINVIRDFRPNNRGIRIFGGRVITSDSDWKYVNVRRLLIFIEASVDRGLQWVVFEPNAEPLWARVRRAIVNFLTLVWRNGALEGTKPEEAFFVRCDRTTMTQTDIDSGRLILQVGVAPVKPAEFVIVRIGLWTAHADD
jgi:uncharacterized protein